MATLCRGRGESTGTPFAGHRWPQAASSLPCAGTGDTWFSTADVRDLLTERDVDVSARTVLYRVQQFAPLLARIAGW